MSVHENDQTVSRIPVLADPTLASVTAAESAVAAFKLALKELGEPVPANDVRAVLTTSGLRLEVTAAPATTVEHYAPQAEAPPAEPAPFKFGDRVWITGDTRGLCHGRPAGTEGWVVGRENSSVLVATALSRREWGTGPRDARWVHVSDLEHA